MNQEEMNTVLNDLEDKVHKVVVPHENTVIDLNDAESIKREISMFEHVLNVGVSVIENQLQVSVLAIVDAAEHWYHMVVPATLSGNESPEAPVYNPEPTESDPVPEHETTFPGYENVKREGDYDPKDESAHYGVKKD